MTKFNNIQKCVKQYYASCLERGMELMDILEEFREDPLPEDLLTCGFTIEEIRRHGQIVGSAYLTNSKKANAPIPEHDLFAPA